MLRILITGSSDGIGLMTARSLIAQGHEVYLHARSESRAAQTREAAPGAAGVLVADLSTVAQMKDMARSANEVGQFDTIVHNAAVGLSNGFNRTADGVALTFAVNSLAPYVLTALMHPPRRRLVYISSGLSHSGDGSLKDMSWNNRGEKGYRSNQAYNDTKLQNVILANAVARFWGPSGVQSYSVDPGWIRTKLGGRGAPGTLEQGGDTMTWLAGITDEKSSSAKPGFYVRREPRKPHQASEDVKLQEFYLKTCAELSGVQFPRDAGSQRSEKGEL